MKLLLPFLALVLLTLSACAGTHPGPATPLQATPAGTDTGNLSAGSSQDQSDNSEDSPTLQEELGFGPDAVVVVVHADDLGMHPDETAGALQAMAFGLCKAGSILVPAPDFARLAKDWALHPDWDLGIHVDFTSEWLEWRWPGVLGPGKTPSLHDSEGFLWQGNDQLSSIDPTEAVAEMRAQVDKVLALGLKPTHLDSHMAGFYARPELFDAAVDLAKEHNLVLVSTNQSLDSDGLVYFDSANCIYYLDDESMNPGLRGQAYRDWMGNLGPGVHFLATHPARVTQALAAEIEAPWIRSGDLAFWTDPSTRTWATQHSIHFSGMREIQAVQAKHLGKMKR